LSTKEDFRIIITGIRTEIAEHEKRIEDLKELLEHSLLLFRDIKEPEEAESREEFKIRLKKED